MAAHGVTPEGVKWGIPPEDRVNRRSVRLMLAFNRDRNFALPHKLLRRAAYTVYRTVGGWFRLLHSSDFQAKQIGDDLYLPHPWGIVAHAEARIGSGCTIYQNVTLGETGTGPGVPTVGDRVFIGAGAVLLGPVVVGDDVIIGANAVVTDDVPAGAIVVGTKPKVIERR